MTGQKKKNAIFYAVAAIGSNTSWYMINNYLMLFYTDVVTLSASAISLIMLIARIWDAVNDPMMGMIIDRTESRWGKFRPYIVIGAPFLTVFNILTFTVFPLEGAAKVVVCLVCYVFAGMAYTALGTAINGICNRLSTDYQERMNYAAIGQTAIALGNVLLAAFTMTIILHFSAGEAADAHGYFMGALIMSLASLPLCLIGAWQCKEIKIDELPPEGNDGQKKSIKTSLKAMMKNKPLLITVWSVLTGAVAVAGRMSLLSYYLIYVAGSYKLIAPVFTVLSAFQMLGNVIVPFGTKKFGKRNFLIIMMLTEVAGLIVMYFGPAANTAFIFVMTAIIGTANAFYSINYGMIYDCVDYGDLKFGVRDEALSTTFLTLGVKIATAIVGAVSVILLASIGYQAGVEQTASVQNGINLIVNILPAVFLAISIVPLIWYKLDNKEMETIKTQLEARNRAAAEEEPSNM